MNNSDFCPICFKLTGEKVYLDNVSDSIRYELACPVIHKSPSFDEKRSHFSYYFEYSQVRNCRYRIGNLMIKTAPNSAHVYRDAETYSYVGSVFIPFDDLIIQMLSEEAITAFVTNYNILK